MKAGTTWMMTIIANMLYENAQFPAPIDELAPWLDMRLPPLDAVAAALQAQTKRRFLKTHLPLHGLPFYDECRYVVVGRDARDVFMSIVNHHRSYTDEVYTNLAKYDAKLGRSFPRDLGDIHEMWRLWMTESWFDNETDGYPYWSHLTHCQSWWDFKHLPNILFVHFNDLLSDTAVEIKRVADYLSIAIDGNRLEEILERVSFNRMKQDFAQINAKASWVFRDGADSFMYKGTNGRWHDVLSEYELELYNDAVARVLTLDAAHWLENGGRVS